MDFWFGVLVTSSPFYFMVAFILSNGKNVSGFKITIIIIIIITIFKNNNNN